MYQGIVRSINYREGKGYIQEMDDSRIMFWLSSVIGIAVVEEDKVVYDIITSPIRQAVNVIKMVD